MVAVAASVLDPQSPPDPSVKTVTVDLQTLNAAFKLCYLAGVGEHDRMTDALTSIRQMAKNMTRSLRRAQPIAREGVESGLLLILRAADEALGKRAETEFYVG